MNQQQPDQISRTLRYYEYLLQARAEKFNFYYKTITRLEKVEPEIIKIVDNLQDIRRGLEKQHKNLLTQRGKRENVLKRLRKTIRNKDDELKQLQKNKEELARVIAMVENLIDDLPIPDNYRPFKQLKGKLPWPLRGKIKNRFGSVKQGHLRWDGLMIRANLGSSVKSIHHGRIVFADWLRGQGLLIIVDHGDGYMSLYAHNEALLKGPGEWVQTGDTIARAGNSGGQRNVGLYFEIRYKGKPTDPRRWCRKA